MKKLSRFSLATALCLLFACTLIMAQNSPPVQGTVKDEKGTVIEGATVYEKGVARNLTQTDKEGHFTLVLKGNTHTVIVSFTGCTDASVTVTGAPISVTLKDAQKDMSDVVVIGYQSQKKRSLTAAVSSISGKDIENVPQSSFDQMLQGRLAGVSVQSQSGAPGSKPNIIIRGSTNMDYANSNGGNTGPLYVIDGVIFDVNAMGTSTGNAGSNPLSLINPNDIESLDVLKDASAAAIYGARGGNGVIVVRTKRAKKNSKPQVTVSSYVGATSRPNLRKVITGTLERQLKLALLQQGLTYTDLQNGSIPQSVTDSLNPAFNNDVDWQGLLLRTQAIVNNQDLSIAGYFSNNNSYRLSMNHYSEQGAVKGFSMERYGPALNFNLNPLPRLVVNANLLMSFETRKHGAGSDFYNPYLFNNNNFPSSLLQLTAEQKAIYDGSSSRYDDNKIQSYVASIMAIDTIFRSLLITTHFSVNSYNDHYAYFSPKVLNGIQNTAYDVQNTNPNWSSESYLTYLKSIGEHHLSVVGGFSAYKQQENNSNAYAAGVNVSGIYTLQTVPSGANLFVSTSKGVKTTESYYGRMSYDFKGKYMLTGSLRRDASSIYSPDYRWGTFYSVSGGWIASDEAFFAPFKTAVSFLKLRASYGVTGQDPGNFYARYQTVYADGSYLGATTGVVSGDAYSSSLGGTPSTYNGTTIISPFNYADTYANNGIKSSSSVRWERYPQLDIGADFSLLRDRVNVTLDWYQKDAKDKYMWMVPAEATTGYKYYSGNLADVRNVGLEIGLSSRNMSAASAFQWSTTFNISFNKNWITRLPNGNRDMLFGDPWFRKTLTLGSPLFSYSLWQVKGVYAKDSDVPVDPITGKRMTYMGTPLAAGDARIVDQNGDYNIDYDDQVSTGKSSLPKFTGGFGNSFSYKGFSLDIFCSYSYGNKVLNGSLSDNLNGGLYQAWNSVAGPAALGDLLGQFWQKPGDQTTYPRLVYPTGAAVNDPWNISRSYFLEDGGFIKLKQIRFGYMVPPRFVHKAGLGSLQLYVVGDNLHIWKQSKDIADPEQYEPTTGSVNIVYPTALKFTFGLQAAF